MNVKYKNPHFNPAIYEPHNIDRMAVESVPENSFVLDIGCATGFMGAYLKQAKNCRVIGVEERDAEAKMARKNLDKLVVGDIETNECIKEVLKATNHNKFDVILATSVIEHLKYPEQFLVNMKKLLKTNGKLIVTTPNIAHWSMRLELIKGNFDYQEYGILDKTHLHFFTPKTYKAMFKKSGYTVSEYRIDDVGGGYPRLAKSLSRFFPSLFAYQMLIVATKK